MSPNRARANVSKSTELLLEIGTEELPAQFVAPALNDLRERATRLLKESRLGSGNIVTLGTPRRLTLVVQDLSEQQEPIAAEVMGPSKAVAFDPSGQPTKAGLGFARGQGVPIEALEVRSTPKGEYVFAVKRDPGSKTASLLPDLLAQLLSSMNFPKAMRWNASAVRFARPIRWLVALYAGKAVRMEFAGIKTSDVTLGHRVLSSGRPIRVKDLKSYMNNLEKASVIVDQQRRRTMIIQQLEEIAHQKRGILIPDEGLIEQATFAVEFPHAISGNFDPEYLELPSEVLITSMKEHQGFFSLQDPKGRLLPNFVAVINMGAKQATIIRAGNERVLSARLADAKFFYNEDRKAPLESRVERLKGVTFHQKLGSVHQKVERLMTLAPKLAYTLGARDLSETAARAAKLSKADLTTGMVGEFPTLQGIMGREYARHDGESEIVAAAIAEHYFPRFADDRLPESPAGRVLSLADRLDTLAGFFGVGLLPSGSQDPFALRRHALAVIRILLETESSLDLTATIQEAFTLYKEQRVPVDDKAPAELERFLAERLRYYLRENSGLRDDLVEGVLSRGQSVGFAPSWIRARVQALQAFSTRPDFDALVIGCKRAENITKGQQDEEVQAEALTEPVERDLYEALQSAERQVTALLHDSKFSAALDALASLKAPIDAFFNGVMVMAEDVQVRRSRLALLVRVRNLFRQFADFSKIQVEAR